MPRVNGLLIRQLREQAVLTQGELADAAGVQRQSIQRIETGHQPPRPSTLRRIAKVLGVDPRSLVLRPDQPDPYWLSKFRDQPTNPEHH
jgi:transcriptional regulator with XRE-family HTH domain